MNNPIVIGEQSFQKAWLSTCKLLSGSSWEAYNLTVTIGDVTAFDPVLHDRICAFYKAQNLLEPKHIAYTIFPHKLYRRVQTSEKLFSEYNREDGLYSRLIKRSNNKWGTYFGRMTNYDYGDEPVNQLQNIIQAINTRSNVW